MIKVLYDNQTFKLQKFGGISRYFAELIKGMKHNEEICSFPHKYYSNNQHLRDSHLTYLDKLADSNDFRFKTRLERLLKKREQSSIIKALQKGDFDVFHPTYYDPYFLKYIFPGKPFVLTVHDMIHEIYYDHLYEYTSDETINKRILIPKANHIIAVSQKTKEDILTFFPEIDSNKISVIHHGSSLSGKPVPANISLPPKYILYVGNRRFYKNFFWFLGIVGNFLREHDLVLICAGGGCITPYEAAYLSNNELTHKVQYVNIIDDDHLKVIYQQAEAMVFPSMYEGFGIPILEAFSCECPAILNDASCFREVAGEAALYFDKDRPEILLDHLTSILNNPVLSAKLKAAGLIRLKNYSWQKTLTQHIDVYKLVNSVDESQVQKKHY